MNNIIGALIVSMAIGGTAPINTNIDKNDYMPSIEANGTLVFGPTEAEKQEEAERLRRAEEARKAAEEAKRAEEERQRKEYEKNHPELLNYDHDIASYTTYYSQSSGVANRNHNIDVYKRQILYSGIGLVKDKLDPLLGKAPEPELVDYIQKKILSYDGVLGTHDLMIHDYGPGRKFASVHVEMAAEGDVLKSHDVIDNIERDFLSKDNLNIIVHYDPIVTKDDIVNDFRSWLMEQVKSIDPHLSIHDLRIVQMCIRDSVPSVYGVKLVHLLLSRGNKNIAVSAFLYLGFERS